MKTMKRIRMYSGKRLGQWLAAALTAAALSATASAMEAGVTKQSIKIGQSAAFSGPAAQLGIQLHAGAKIYFDSVNAQGGVHGRKIELVTADDRYEPGPAAENTKRLIEQEGVFALFGYVGTPTSNAALPIFTAAKVPFFAPFTGAQSLREPFNRYIFNIRAGYIEETEHIVQHLVRLGINKLAVFHQNDAYGQAGLAGVQRALKKRDITLVETATVERNSTDVAAAVAKLLPQRPDAIIQISTYAASAAFIKEMKKAGYTGQFHNVSFVGSQALAQALGPDGQGVGVSQVMPFPWRQSSLIINEYHKALKEAGNKQPDFSSLEGYVAAKIFVEGLRRAGPELTREKFIKALESINLSNYDIGFPVSFSSTNHNGSSFVDMTAITRNERFMN